MQEVKPRSFVRWKTFVFQNKNSNGNPDSAPTEPPDRSRLHCHHTFGHPGNVRPAHLLVVSEGSFQWRLRTRGAGGDLPEGGREAGAGTMPRGIVQTGSGSAFGRATAGSARVFGGNGGRVIFHGGTLAAARDLSHFAAGTRARLPQEAFLRSEEHTSELQSPCNLVCRLLLEKKKKTL